MTKITSIAVAAILFALMAASPARSDRLHGADAAYHRGDYARAAGILQPLAHQGNAEAQALLGFMYENGFGVPQSAAAAVKWYTLSAEQGNATAQYLLGLMYDKGHGAPKDDVIAHMWLNLATANSHGRRREYYARIRDAVASKMTPAQVTEAQWLAHRSVPEFDQ